MANSRAFKISYLLMFLGVTSCAIVVSNTAGKKAAQTSNTDSNLALDPGFHGAWAQQLNTSTTNQKILSDSSSNVYIASQFTNSAGSGNGATLSPGNRFFLNTDGNANIAVMKMDSSGNLQWGMQFNTTTNLTLLNFKLDSNGNSLVLFNGVYTTLTAYDKNNTTTTLTPRSTDMILASISSDGILNYILGIGGTTGSVGSSAEMILDSEGSVYIAGHWTGLNFAIYNTSALLLSPLTKTAAQPSFVAKISSLGALNYFRWFDSHSMVYSTYIHNIKLSSSKDLVVTLSGSGNISLNGFATPPAPDSNLINTFFGRGSTDLLVSSINESGELNFARLLAGANTESPAVTKVDSSGNVWIGLNVQAAFDIYDGNETSLLNVYASTYDAALVKLSSSGSIDLVKTFRGTYEQYIRDLWIDTAGNAYIMGQFHDIFIVYDPTGFTKYMDLSNASTDNRWIVKLDSNGDVAGGLVTPFEYTQAIYNSFDFDETRGELCVAVSGHSNVGQNFLQVTTAPFTLGASETTPIVATPYRTLGTYVYTFVVKGDGSFNFIRSIAATSSGNIYTQKVKCDGAGGLHLTLLQDSMASVFSLSGASIENSNFAGGSIDSSYYHFDNSGNISKSRYFQGSLSDGAISFALDTTLQNAVLLGYSYSSSLFGFSNLSFTGPSSGNHLFIESTAD